MERYQIILAYDGTLFEGSQRQAKARTVQGELEKALRQIGWTERSVLMAGRTDTGVHASGQVAAFDFLWAHGLEDLQRALNANLSQDMAVMSVNIVSDDFHPRFSATSRRYRYRLFCQPNRDPLRDRYAWRVWPEVDGDALRRSACLFIGEHDFAAFGSPPRKESSTIRTLMQANWQQEGDEWFFDVQANAFLYHMVRRLVFVQVAVAQERLSVDEVARALSEQAECLTGLAPAEGLTLVQVTYPDNLVQSKN